MKSVVTLYYKSLLNKEKNFVLDDVDGNMMIETYLSTLTKSTINDFQYTKHKLSLSIKINKNQTNLDMIDSNELNYVKIQNYSDGTPVTREKAYYYFVINKSWKSKETIELVLSMDTLNTFKYNVGYELSSKTLVKRMHKDRFIKTITNLQILKLLTDVTPNFPSYGSYVFDSITFIKDGVIEYETLFNVVIDWNSSSYPTPTYRRGIVIYNLTEEQEKWFKEHQSGWALYSLTYQGVEYKLNVTVSLPFITRYKNIRNIDLRSEDITCPLYKKKENVLIPSGEAPNIDWTLYYRNSADVRQSPIDCYLVPSQQIDINYPSANATIDKTCVDVGNVLIISQAMNGEQTFSCPNGVVYRLALYTYSASWKEDYALMIMRDANDNNNIAVYQCIFTDAYGAYGSQPKLTLLYVGASITLNNPPAKLYGWTGAYANLPANYQWFNYTQYIKNTEVVTTIQNVSFVYSKEAINRLLEENVKLITIPYAPTPLEYDSVNNRYTINSMWKYYTATHVLKLENFNTPFKNEIVTDVYDITEDFTYGVPQSLDIDIEKTRSYIDSKLFHSDYYRPKFVYDSFTKDFALEQIDYYETRNKNIDLYFSFDFVMSRNIVSKFLFMFKYTYKYATEDYPNVLAVSRNNEEVLYSSQYLDYLRTGYNYDLKSKERQQKSSAVGIGLSVTGLVASIVAGFLPGGKGVAVAGVLGSSIGIASQMVSYAKTTSQNEENIQRKLEESQRQSVSVLNADDYDLLYAYTSNKAKLCYYKVSPTMEKILDDLFYYCGYTINEQFIPSVNTRYWFNFIQASLIIKETSNLPTEIEDDIKERFEEGVTFLHYRDSKFDFNQEMENWETSIM